jgi:hypothetical protein
MTIEEAFIIAMIIRRFCRKKNVATAVVSLDWQRVMQSHYRIVVKSSHEVAV